MKKARQGWVWLAVLLVIFVAISYFSYTPKPQLYPNYVSDSPSPTGVKGLYTYLNKERKAKRWSHTPDLLPRGQANQLLMMVEPSIIPDEKQMKAYMDFVAAGNTILLLKNNPKGMFDFKTAPIADVDDENTVMKVVDQNKKAYKAEIRSDFRLETRQGDIVLLHDQAGTVALKRNVGKGQLIVSVTPEWLTNGNILAKDHLPLVISLLNESGAPSILFDEYLHGKEDASSTLTVYPKWFILLILQGIILAILWLWLQGKRFGPIFAPREDSVRFSDEGIRALSAWYLRGRRYHDSLLIQADYVKLLLQEHWQIPYSREWQNLSDFLERKWQGMKPTEIHSFLKGLVAVLEKEKISKQEYLLWSRKLDQLQKEVEQG